MATKGGVFKTDALRFKGVCDLKLFTGQRKIYLGLLLASAMLTGVLETPAQAAFSQLELSNSDIKQGAQAQIVLKTDVSSSYRVEVVGQTIAMQTDSGEAHRAFVAIPADQKAGGYTLRIKNAENQEVASQKIEVRPGSFYTQNISFYRPPLSEAQQATIDQENALVDVARNSQTPESLWSGSFMLPVPHRISSVYGTRRYLNGKYNGYHGGVDFASPMSYPIKAPAAGKVTLAKYFSKYNANGNTLFLDHGLGVTSGYIHISKFAVKEGDSVSKGQTVAYIGSTGRSTGPHLHWGFYLNGQNTDGLAWIKFSRNLAL